MICPHCSQTIREEERYLMARDPDGDWVWPKLGALQGNVGAPVLVPGRDAAPVLARGLELNDCSPDACVG